MLNYSISGINFSGKFILVSDFDQIGDFKVGCAPEDFPIFMWAAVFLSLGMAVLDSNHVNLITLTLTFQGGR